MRIGELSEKTGVSRDALRFYETRGMLVSFRRDNGYRDYAENAVQLVSMIKLAQSLGFSLSEIAPEMAAISEHGMGSEKVANLLAAKLVDVDDRIADLTRRRTELAEILEKICPISANP